MTKFWMAWNAKGEFMGNWTDFEEARAAGAKRVFCPQTHEEVKW